MTYQETLSYMYARLPMFSRIGKDAYKSDITNTVLLCERVGNPQLKFKSVHVAGTNGKGSVSHMLAAIFQTAGYKTGLYTSPHLKDFRERIKVNGDMVEKDFVTTFMERVQPAIDELSPSFFEITVAMAFEYFAQQQVDIAIIETGLGGRLDSTNIIIPELSVITNISWDHTNILGDTLEKIAYEKAGIIKRGIPVVVGKHAATHTVFEEKATQEQAPLSFADSKRLVTGFTFQKHMLVAEVTKLHTDDKHYYYLDLTGIYQTKNLVTVLEAVAILKQQGWILTDQHVEKALQQVKKLTGLHGRWETIYEHPSVIVDVAHNEDGIKEIVSQLEMLTYQKLYIIIGMVKDSVDRAKRHLTIDFTGTSEQQADNFNAPLPVVRAACLYVMRTLLPAGVPMNDGCLRPVTIRVPEGTMLSPRYPAAVVAGNVETSQVVTDALFGALGAVAASQGTMNNFTFGDDTRQYYETIAGGAGAGPGFAGAAVVQTHMTNSRMTDPEIMEQRFPVLVERFAIRQGSGGAGANPGGDGATRRVRFLAPMRANILSNRRRVPPFGLAGGAPGGLGANRVERADGSIETLGATAGVDMAAGDVFVIETPGGGGYGTAGD